MLEMVKMRSYDLMISKLRTKKYLYFESLQ